MLASKFLTPKNDLGNVTMPTSNHKDSIISSIITSRRLPTGPNISIDNYKMVKHNRSISMGPSPDITYRHSKNESINGALKMILGRK